MLLDVPECLLHERTPGGAEVVASLNRREPFAHHLQTSLAMGRFGRARCFFRRHSRPSNVGGERFGIRGTQMAKLLHELGIRVAINGSGLEHAHLATCCKDLFPNPPEILSSVARGSQ